MSYPYISSAPSSSHRQDPENLNEPKLYRTLTERKKFNKFFEYCRHERCHENLLFWKLVQKYKITKTKERQSFIMEKIFEQFVLDDSEYEINLNAVTKSSLYWALVTYENDNHCIQNIFDKAQHEVYLLIECGAWVRYKKILIEESKSPSNLNNKILESTCIMIS